MSRLIDADRLIETIRQHHYMLADRFNSQDWGMFTIGIEEAIDIQPTINEWISVEKELPENDERVLVTLINGTRYKYKTIARYCGDNEWVDDNWDDVDGVVAWKPIEPYIGDKE